MSELKAVLAAEKEINREAAAELQREMERQKETLEAEKQQALAAAAAAAAEAAAAEKAAMQQQHAVDLKEMQQQKEGEAEALRAKLAASHAAQVLYPKP